MLRAIACMVVAALSLGAAPARREIPFAFRGQWTNQPRFCNFEGDDLDSVLTVTATEVGYFENHWQVRSVRHLRGGIRITYFPRKEFEIYAPGYLRLSADAQRIYLNTRSGDTGYKRCPKDKT